MTAYHGVPKVIDGKMGGLIQDLTELGWPLPALQGFAASYIEFVGGILLVVGLFTRPIALASVILFAIITFVYLGGDPFVAREKAFLFMLMSLYVLFNGPGKLSIDHLLFKKNAAP